MVFLSFIVSVSAQCTELMNIVNSQLSSDLKQEKIDSLLSAIETNDHQLLGDCYHDVANKWYFENFLKNRSQSKLDKAIVYSQMAVDVKKSVSAIDTISLRKSLYNLAYFEWEGNRNYKAVKHYKEILLFNIRDKKNIDTRTDLGLIYLELGDFEKAKESFENILVDMERGDYSHRSALSAHILLADTHGMMDYRKYKERIHHHLNLGDSIIKDLEISDGFQADQINLLRGNLLLKNNRLSEALNSYNAILQNDNFLAQEFAVVYNNMGFCQLKNNDLIRSGKNLAKSTELDSTYSDPYDNLGDLHLEKNEFVKGMQYYQRAIELVTNENQYVQDLKKLPDTELLELTHDKISLLSHLTTKANGWLRYYEEENDNSHLTQALKTFEKADALIGIIKEESTEYQSKLYWREQSSKLYMSAIKACFLLHRPEDAYYFMERNKALLLLEDLTNEEAKVIFQIPIEKAQQEFDIKRAIFLSENKLQENTRLLNKDSLAAYKQTIWDNKYRYEKFIDSLNQTYPEYAKFKKNVDVMSIMGLKANFISEDKATLHYILNENEGYGLLTTLDTIELFRLDKIKILNEEVEKLVLTLSKGTSDLNDFKTISNNVFQTLVPKRIYGKIKGKQLTIIPDYTLQQIPFESLVVDKGELKYLFQEVEIGYAYSASLLGLNKQGKDSAKDILAIAPVTFDSLNLPELYFSENEVNSIAKVYRGKTFLKEKASKANFIEKADDSKIIHLATHADVGDGANPWIAFSDSKLFLKEIYATKTEADMVVLSACNTSTGELKRGEGVMSLARGFFYSGAKSVVSTLWPVADESGKEVLINFYKNLDKGYTKSKALQKAKLDYLTATEEEELKHPYYWAGFVVLGDNSPISDKPTSPWLLLGSGLLGTGILVFGYKKIKARRAAA